MSANQSLIHRTFPTLVRGFRASPCRASSVATPFRPMDNETDLARSPLCPLAGSCCGDAVAGPGATDARYLRRPMLGRSRSVSHEWNSRSRLAPDPRLLALSRVERPHLCDLWRQARRVFLQSRCRQSSGSLGRSKVLSPTVLSCSDSGGSPRRRDSLFLSSLSLSGRISRRLFPHQRSSVRRQRRNRPLAHRTLLPLHPPRQESFSRRDSPPSLVSAGRRRSVGNQHGRRCRRDFATCHSALAALCPQTGGSNLAITPRRR